MSETYNGCDTGEYIAVPGPQGPQGQKGEQGLRGPVGPEGPQGNPGPMGPQGCQGPKGDRGPRGEKGDKGEPGTPGARGPEGPEGPRGCNGKDGVVKWSEEITQDHINQLRGPKGEKGDQGPRGVPGMVGPTGARGPIGETGPIGPQGPAGPTGPKGPRGDIGQRGPTGPKGEPGGVQIVDHVNDDATWSSKQITEYALHGKVDWQHKKIGWTRDTAGEEIDITDTANGHVKNFKILGRTMTNLSTMSQNYTKDFKGLYTDDQNKVILFDSSLDNITELKQGRYTVSCYVNHSNQVGSATAKILITEIVNRNGEQKTRGELIAEVKRSGLVKTTFDVDAQHSVTRIEIVPFYPVLVRPDQEAYEVTYKANKFLLLRGDYNNRMTPEYFYKTRGVGNAVPGTTPTLYNVIVESRGKNLLNLEKEQVHKNAFVEKIESEVGGPFYIFREDMASNHITYIIHCKPRTTYTFSANLTDEEKNSHRFRLGIIDFEEYPTNGERGHYCYFEAQTFENRVEKSFVTAENSNYMVLYLANVGQGLNLTINDIASKIQLEEGAHPTPYEPYITNVRTFKLNQQLKDNEYLFWKPDRTEGDVLLKGQYYIHKEMEGNKFWDEPTENDEEQFPHTFDGKTYLYVKSKIPSVLEGDFPIKAHPDYHPKENTYTRAEADSRIDTKLKEYTYPKSELFNKNDFIFRDDNMTEDNNLLRLPSKSGNSFIMQWKEVSVSSGMTTPSLITFPFMTSILSAQATAYIENDHDLPSPTEAEWICPIIMKVPSAGVPSLKVYANAPNGKSLKLLVTVIGRGKVIE